MTLIAAYPLKDAAVFVTDTWSQSHGYDGPIPYSGAHVTKVRSFAHADIAVAMNGSVMTGERFMNMLAVCPLPEGFDSLEGLIEPMFRAAYKETAEATGRSLSGDVAAADPLAMSQVTILGFSRNRGTYVGLCISKMPDLDFEVQVVQPGDGICTPAPAGFAWNLKGSKFDAFLSEVQRLSLAQFEEYKRVQSGWSEERQAATGSDHGSGGYMMATILRPGTIEQRLVGRYPNAAAIMADMGAEDRPLPSKTAAKKPTRKPGRNEPCPCGSGHKFKRCCDA